jgi:tRNA pseudouridine13 synthase
MVRYRATVEDFEVTELPLYEPCGEGDHCFVFVEKRGRTTEQVAATLARAVGVPTREVGYAGRKDRHAVTRQWFSVPLRAGSGFPQLAEDGVRVMTASRHRHKLRTGQLAGNRFRLVLRELSAAAADRAAARLTELSRFGFANRFGAQRFGRAGDNARAGEQLWRRGAARGRDRRAARFLLSALQSDVFNEVLARRGELLPDADASPGTRAIDRLLRGDVAVVHRSGGPFLVEDPEREQPRADALEISPTGPIFGDRMRPAAGDVASLESSVLAARGVEPRARVAGVRMPGTRRALRARVLDPVFTCAPGGQAVLEVTLEPGVYATVLLEELFPDEELVEGPPLPPPQIDETPC